MIEIFRTNIQQPFQATQLIDLLLQHFPESRINIDLHDCDKVLRIEGCNFLPSKVVMLVNEHGFACSVLE